jgi:hypothetical protein
VTAADERAAEFVSVTLADTEEVWAGIFPDQIGQTYQPVTLVLFKGFTQSACGGASAQTGPFYCPVDRKVYLDTDFFVTLERQLGAGGDFAAAYVVAHEVGHYVQDELGILGEAQRGRQQGADSEAVRVELQADCFAGVWAHHAQAQLGTIESGDVEEAMNAAEQIGDDTLRARRGRPCDPTRSRMEHRAAAAVVLHGLETATSGPATPSTRGRSEPNGIIRSVRLSMAGPGQCHGSARSSRPAARLQQRNRFVNRSLRRHQELAGQCQLWRRCEPAARRMEDGVSATLTQALLTLRQRATEARARAEDGSACMIGS